MPHTSAAKYTIVIPTRNRQTYCVAAVLSILAAQRSDVRIIILDNSDDRALLQNLLEQLDILQHVQFVESADRVLRMDENWERAIPLLETEWVSFIGDDDGFKMDAFDILDFLTENIESDAFSWSTLNYKWPCFPGDEGGLLNLKYSELSLSRLPGDIVTQAQQNWICDDKWPLIGPSVYHGVVRRRVIENIKRDHGRYFLSHTVDYASGITNARYVDHFVQYSGTVSIQGSSGKSGTADIAELERTRTVRDYLDELGTADIVYDEFLDAGLHVPIVVSSFKAILEKLGLAFSVPPQRFLDSCVLELLRVRDPQCFETERVRLLAFAKKHALDAARLEAAQFTPSTRMVGPLGNAGLTSFDTTQFGWNGVFDVATKFHGLILPFAADQLRHWRLLAGYAQRFDDAKAKRAVEKRSGQKQQAA
ncbi:MAG: glycosyltransferase family A protein [Pseudomonadota bacterium]